MATVTVCKTTLKLSTPCCCAAHSAGPLCCYRAVPTGQMLKHCSAAPHCMSSRSAMQGAASQQQARGLPHSPKLRLLPLSCAGWSGVRVRGKHVAMKRGRAAKPMREQNRPTAEQNGTENEQGTQHTKGRNAGQ